MSETYTTTLLDVAETYTHDEKAWSQIWAPLFSPEISPSKQPGNGLTTSSSPSAYQSTCTIPLGTQELFTSQQPIRISSPRTFSGPSIPTTSPSISAHIASFTAPDRVQSTNTPKALQEEFPTIDGMYSTPIVHPGAPSMPNTLIPSAFSTSTVTTTTTTTATAATTDVVMKDAPAAIRAASSELVDRLVRNATDAYAALHPLAKKVGVVSCSLDEQVPVVKWVIFALVGGVGAGMAAAYLYHRSKTHRPPPPPIPIPENEDAATWRRKARVVAAFLERALKTNGELRQTLRETREQSGKELKELEELNETLQEELEEANEHSKALQHGINTERLLREKKEVELQRIKSTSNTPQQVQMVGGNNRSAPHQRHSPFPMASPLGPPSSTHSSSGSSSSSTKRRILKNSPINPPSSSQRSSTSRLSTTSNQRLTFTPRETPSQPLTASQRRSRTPSSPLPTRHPTPRQQALKAFIKQRVESGCARLEKGDLTSDELTGVIDGEIQDFKKELSSTPPSSGGSSNSQKGKRKLYEIIETEEREEGDVFLTTPEAQLMDPAHRRVKRVATAQKLDLGNIPKLERSTTVRQVKHGRTSMAAGTIPAPALTPVLSPVAISGRRSKAPKKRVSIIAASIEEPLSPRRSPRKHKVTGSMNIQALSRRSRSPEK
ncbi:hypothetical protein BU26DRAFT_603096 [Trematosphaeria pertusa]|uniref:Uncharacterized protein n=1 Tax=Trematosphaeria pertusa TaxID=390896 RepID=A0A6A6IK01_9PLEO|nr:uncharacterized protein BU26DRAFT_603096 [Trematosphaeria pertusa]KAF2250507.1 hypothetical protein BU26DRAFT_603096 [Trematosphaeria pertusa]